MRVLVVSILLLLMLFSSIAVVRTIEQGGSFYPVRGNIYPLRELPRLPISCTYTYNNPVIVSERGFYTGFWHGSLYCTVTNDDILDHMPEILHAVSHNSDCRPYYKWDIFSEVDSYLYMTARSYVLMSYEIDDIISRLEELRRSRVVDLRTMYYDEVVPYIEYLREYKSYVNDLADLYLSAMNRLEDVLDFSVKHGRREYYEMLEEHTYISVHPGLPENLVRIFRSFSGEEPPSSPSEALVALIKASGEVSSSYMTKIETIQRATTATYDHIRVLLNSCESGSGRSTRVTTTSTAASRQVGDSYEPDNSRSLAKPIYPGRSQIHTIYPSRDVDYLRFELRGTCTVTIETYGSSDEDTVIYLYSSSGNLIARDDDSGPGHWSRIVTRLGPGVYYVKVSAYSSRETFQYHIRVLLNSCER